MTFQPHAHVPATYSIQAASEKRNAMNRSPGVLAVLEISSSASGQLRSTTQRIDAITGIQQPQKYRATRGLQFSFHPAWTLLLCLGHHPHLTIPKAISVASVVVSSTETQSHSWPNLASKASSWAQFRLCPSSACQPTRSRSYSHIAATNCCPLSYIAKLTHAIWISLIGLQWP